MAFHQSISVGGDTVWSSDRYFWNNNKLIGQLRNHSSVISCYSVRGVLKHSKKYVRRYLEHKNLCNIQSNIDTPIVYQFTYVTEKSFLKSSVLYK